MTMKKSLCLLLVWALFALSMTGQTVKPGWVLYHINGNEASISVPSSMKVYDFKEKGFAVTKNVDGSYSVRTEESILFVPAGSTKSYDEDDMGIDHYILVQFDDSGDMAKAVKVMRNSSLLRGAMSLGLKKGIGVDLGDEASEELSIIKSSKVLVKEVSGSKAVTWDMTMQDGQKKTGLASIYMMEKKGKALMLMLMSQKGKPGFTVSDKQGVVASFRY